MLSADAIRWLLRKRYCAPEYGIAFEVGDRTGNETHRHLDAVTMNLFPSRGLPLCGFEIKVDRQDMRREIATPDKAEPIAQYLDYFFVVFPQELRILDLEIPPGWGLMSASNDGLKMVKPAEKIPALPLTRSFVAALFRAICAEDEYRAMKMIEAKSKELEASFEHRVQINRDQIRSENDQTVTWAKSIVKQVEDAGFKWADLHWNDINFVRAIKMALTFRCLAVDRVEEVALMTEEFAIGVRKELAQLITLKAEEARDNKTNAVSHP
jgi:hypothetical protein